MGPLASVSPPLVSRRRGSGSEGVPAMAALFRDEHGTEGQGSESWLCSALNLLFDLGLAPSPLKLTFLICTIMKSDSRFLLSLSS